jgi:hypothetical protein
LGKTPTQANDEGEINRRLIKSDKNTIAHQVCRLSDQVSAFTPILGIFCARSVQSVARVISAVAFLKCWALPEARPF